MKRRILGIWSGVLLFFCLLVWDTSVYGAAEENEPAQGTETIAEGVFLNGIGVSGMTKDQAIEAVEKELDQIQGYNIQLRVGDQVVNASAGELGLYWKDTSAVDRALSLGQKGNLIKRYKAKKDLKQEPVRLTLRYEVDTEKTKALINQRCLPLEGDPVNAVLRREDEEFVIERERAGVSLKVEESVALVAEYLTKLWHAGEGFIELSVDRTEAPHKSAGLYEVQNILGKASTDYSSSSANRATNIQNGTEKLNGVVLFPGEEFSVCDAMVPFTEENGYELGASYADGAVVESFGGGICQVSTTLYLALLRSELEITDRSNHSMLVNYVKPSMDAAIAEGSKDLKFKNNLEYPIYIEGYTYGGEVGFNIYGKEYRPEGREVTYESEKLEETKAGIELVASSKPFGSIEQTGSPHTGCVAKLWKVVNENGEETRTQVNDSNYAMQPTKYSVGTVTTDGDAKSKISAAIDENDLNAAYEVINSYGGSGEE